MSDDQIQGQDELTSLKARADLLGIAYHPSIGLEKLREKVNGKITGSPSVDADPAPEAAVAKAPAVVVETENQRLIRLKQDAERLIRIRVTCMNPMKKEWTGEIFTVGNAAVGTFKRYVPFNADDGWHVPHIILQQMNERQCQVFTTSKTKNGVSVRQGKLIREFAIEILDPLTKDEIDELARRQAASHAVD